jgi:hypothetical protein
LIYYAELRLCWYAAQLLRGVPTLESHDVSFVGRLSFLPSPHTNKGVIRKENEMFRFNKKGRIDNLCLA